MNQPVTVILSHKNSARTLGRCLDSLLNQDYPAELIKIIVVDAGSTDGSINIVKMRAQFRVQLIILEGCSESEGQNLGVELAETEYIFFTNSDIYVPRDWIKKHVYWLNKGCSVVGGKVFWGGDKYAFAWNNIVKDKTRSVQEQGSGLGFSNCSTRKSLLVKLGGLKNLIGHQDTEFAFTIVREGYMMILDFSIEVYHDHPFKSLRGAFLRSMGYARNHIIMMRYIYGRIVAGATYPVLFSLPQVILNVSGIQSARIWFQYQATAKRNNITVPLWEFIFLRQLNFVAGHIVGDLVGAWSRNPTLKSLKYLH